MTFVINLRIRHELNLHELLDACFPLLVELLRSQGVLLFQIALLLKVFELISSLVLAASRVDGR
jgi:hypothetical protein